MVRRKGTFCGWLATAILVAITACAPAADKPKPAMSPAKPELMNLKVGDHCRIWIVEPVKDNKKSYEQYTGDVAAVTRHSILLTKVTVRKWSEQAKTIVDATRLSKIFPNIGSSSEKRDTVQVFRAKITQVDIVKP